MRSWHAVPEPIAKVPYSVFLEQIEADNVQKVSIVGGEISGGLFEALTWPPAVEPETAVGDSRARRQPPARDYLRFSTTFPKALGDPRLLPLLQEHAVEVSVQPPPSPWASAVLINMLPLLLLVGFFWWMGRRASNQQGSIFGGFTRTRARHHLQESSRVTFNDVAGCDTAKNQLAEEVDFLRRPEKYHAIGARIPRGLLLIGPPGTGKTLLGRAVAGEAEVPFFRISGSEFVEMFVGVGAGRVRDLFKQAKEAAPSIVFIDELDAVGRRRGTGIGNINDEREQTLNQLLVEMDGFDERQEVIVLAATNRPDVLDPALLRPGRFDRQVTVLLPDRVGRKAILQVHCRPLSMSEEVNFDTLAGATTGMSGADLGNLCNEAALTAARAERKEVVQIDFENALDKLRLGDEQKLFLSDEQKRIVAWHEAGHALVAWMSPLTDPVFKVTIVPHGQALGVTEQLPGEDRYNYSEPYLLAQITVALAGRTAEEIVFGEATTGAENDLREATRLARRMVTRWGMGKLGLTAYDISDENPFLGYELAQGRSYSDTTAARIDQEVSNLLEASHEVANTTLKENRSSLDRLATALLSNEVIEQTELETILGRRPAS
jgi:cell division protease FtsH